jgi:hypothetical protein
MRKDSPSPKRTSGAPPSGPEIVPRFRVFPGLTKISQVQNAISNG